MKAVPSDRAATAALATDLRREP